MIYDNFLHSVDGLFILLVVSFTVQKLFNLMYSHLFIFAFVAFAVGGKWKKKKELLPRLMSNSLLPVFL